MDGCARAAREIVMDPIGKTDAAEALRERLQFDLRSAMKARRTGDVAVLRQLIAAIDNAGAVPLPARPQAVPREVERRHLGSEDVQALLRRESEMRRQAAEELERLGRRGEAQTARSEMAIVGRYLATPPRGW